MKKKNDQTGSFSCGNGVFGKYACRLCQER